MSTHGTYSSYTAGCRCEECRAARVAYSEAYRARKNELNVPVDRDLLSDVLNEMFPDGLTDDCPARAGNRGAA